MDDNHYLKSTGSSGKADYKRLENILIEKIGGGGCC